MRSKAPLALIEQMIMLLVFALAAALCLQAFVKSDAISSRSEARDQASAAAQTAAETIRHYGGDSGSALAQAAEDLGASYEQGVLWLDYGEDWNPDPSGPYRLTAQGVPAEVDGLMSANVLVSDGGDVLFEMNISWQGEVSAHG